MSANVGSLDEISLAKEPTLNPGWEAIASKTFLLLPFSTSRITYDGTSLLSRAASAALSPALAPQR